MVAWLASRISLAGQSTPLQSDLILTASSKRLLKLANMHHHGPIGHVWASDDVVEGDMMPKPLKHEISPLPENSPSIACQEHSVARYAGFVDDELSHFDSESRSAVTGVTIFTPTSSSMGSLNGSSSHLHPHDSPHLVRRWSNFLPSHSSSQSLDQALYPDNQGSLPPSRYSNHDGFGDDASSQTAPDHGLYEQHERDWIFGDDSCLTIPEGTITSPSDTVVGAGAGLPVTETMDSSNPASLPLDEYSEMPENFDVVTTQSQWAEPWSVHSIPNYHPHQSASIITPVEYAVEHHQSAWPQISLPDQSIGQHVRAPDGIPSMSFPAKQQPVEPPPPLPSTGGTGTSKLVECSQCGKELRPSSMS